MIHCERSYPIKQLPGEDGPSYIKRAAMMADRPEFLGGTRRKSSIGKGVFFGCGLEAGVVMLVITGAAAYPLLSSLAEKVFNP